jgi:integrase
MTRLAEVVSQVKQQQQHKDINSMKVLIAGKYPNTIIALHLIDNEYSTPKRRKGFSLIKIESKKHGFLYYARFSHNGKMLPTKWNTHTNDPEAAAEFARENKDRLVEGYLQRKDRRMYTMLLSFYEKKPETDSGETGDIYSIRISERARREYQSIMTNKFIPFLKLEKITCFEQLTAISLHKFQDHLLAKKIKPQTVNNNVNAIRKVLASLTRKGIIQDNPGTKIKGIPVKYEDKKARGCYDLNKLNGVFNKKWKDDTSQLLCMLIYTTGMRNIEIKRMKFEDIDNIEGCYFIHIKNSKTRSGIRMVPLHNLVFQKLKAWLVKNKKTPQSLLFDFHSADVFGDAAAALRDQLGVSEEEAAAENITFYSGRHFWKTLMSAEGLGEDIEEIFMGHKVSHNVAKLYNHRDKQGKEMMAKKARQVFSILDRCIFSST